MRFVLHDTDIAPIDIEWYNACDMSCPPRGYYTLYLSASPLQEIEDVNVFKQELGLFPLPRPYTRIVKVNFDI